MDCKELVSPLTFDLTCILLKVITNVYDRPPNINAALMNTCSDQVDSLPVLELIITKEHMPSRAYCVRFSSAVSLKYPYENYNCRGAKHSKSLNK